MVDEELHAVFESIDNRTPEQQEAINKEFDDNQKQKQIIQLRHDVFQCLIRREEEHATEAIVFYIENKFFLYTTRDDLKSEIWIYEDGIYKPNGESFIKMIAREVLLHAYTPQRVNKIIAKIQADTMVDPAEFFNTQYLDEICVENGILNLETRKVSDFTPEKIFFNKLPIKYNPDAVCKNIDKFFSEILKDERDKIILYELAGFCLHKDYFIEKALMFIGIGRNGKSKTLSLLRNFLGIENCCAVRLSQMEPNNSALCELHNRLVNLAGDLSNVALKETGVFRELTGRDEVQVKRKFLTDLKFTNYAKMVFACNELPRVYDLSEGFWSRWVVLDFPWQFLPEKEIEKKSAAEKAKCKIQDPNIIDKLTTDEELSGLLNEAIDGLDRLKINGDFSYTPGTSEVKNYWIRKSDSFTAFCFDMIEEDPENYITKKTLRQTFNSYCKKHRVKGTSDQNIKIVLENMFGVVGGKRFVGNPSPEREYVWEGIKFKEGVDL